MSEPALTTPSISSRPKRSSASASSYAEVTKINTYTGTADDGIAYYVLHGGSQAAAAKAVDCCPKALNRAVLALKEEGAWDDHVTDIFSSSKGEEIGTTASSSGQAAGGSSAHKRELEMPTPNSLGKQIKSGATRLGDGRPYGGKGNSWGEYREGHKIGTAAVKEAGITMANATRASARLAEAGVRVGARTIYDAAKVAPGKTPVKMGDQTLKLPHSFIEAGRKVIVEMRELNMPNLKCMVKAELMAMMKGTQYEVLFEDGMLTDCVYYNFLDRSDLYSNDTRPLEDDRLLWRHSENARRQYMVWAETFIDCKLAVWNPKFAADPQAYFTSPDNVLEELILWYPGAEHHVGSSDETDVGADETARGKSPAQRSVLVAEPGSRRGHGKAPPGGGGPANRGWVKSRKERALEPVLDSGEVPAAKGGSKFSFVGTDFMSGNSAQTLIVSKLSTEALAKKVDLDAVSPESTLVDTATGARRKARFIQTDSGGVELSTMTTILEDIFIPALPSRGTDAEARLSREPTVEDPDDVMCWDGLKQHLSLEWVRASKAKRVRTLIRYSHGSQDNQHEDFVNYAHFKPAFEVEKMKLRVDKVAAAKQKAADPAGDGSLPPRAISAQERIAASKLTDADVLRCAKKPWEDAFSKELTSSGWQKEGIFPKFNCALYWRLRVEESKKGKSSARPPVQPDEHWLQKFDVPHSSAARISGDPKILDEEAIEAEVERRVAARIAGADAPEKLPPVGAANVFKLPGSASGEAAMKVLFEKEVERRVDERLKKHRQDDRDKSKDEKLNANFALAVTALDSMASSGLETLKVPELKAILEVHKVKPVGKKEDIQGQVHSLLAEKTPAGASQEAVVAEMKRLTRSVTVSYV